ncbi:FAD-dependent oxidoreductase [bacterium]|nr:FAD-dependent oxidoreductase [bacterium]
MRIENLAELSTEQLHADLVIVGAGPAGLTIARELIGSGVTVIVLESGLDEESQATSDLNRVELHGSEWTEKASTRRIGFHSELARFWDHTVQGFGVRYRGLGGSSQVWAGKSAAFDEDDFVRRDWVSLSGWPLSLKELGPYFQRAGSRMNLGPHVYDERFWEMAGLKPPRPAINPQRLRSFFWQFARSPSDAMDFMRFGKEFRALEAQNVRVVTNATVTEILTDPSATRATGVEAKSICGRTLRVTAGGVVLAASAIENARLLLVSNRNAPGGLGNRHDVVGRYLCDHPGARIGHFSKADADQIAHRFGFFGLNAKGRSHMFMHGLALSPEAQANEQLLNGALYMMEDRAPDDPWDALKRLLKLNSARPGADIMAVITSPGAMLTGLGIKLFQSPACPAPIKNLLVDAMIRFHPNMVVREHLNRGLPHKLDGVWVDAITEQAPDPDNRVTLSDQTDRFGVPLPSVRWVIGETERRTLSRMGQILAEELPRAGLPAPTLEEWVVRGALKDAVCIDMGHTSGTTRMSTDPKTGVVDPALRVHGVGSLYIAGGSVFPTSGHANPTLMIVTLAIRLADQIRHDFARRAPELAVEREPIGVDII